MLMRRSSIIIIFTIVVIIAFMSFMNSEFFTNRVDVPEQEIDYTADDFFTVHQTKKLYDDREALCLSFMEEKMIDVGAIMTNYKPIYVSDDLPYGTQVLSESEGLMMLYYAADNQYQAYLRHYDYIVENMLNENDTVRWRVGNDVDDAGAVSASIDDLRIIRALLFGDILWENDDFKTLALEISEALMADYIIDDQLILAYDHRTDEPTRSVEISYLDLFTMRALADYDQRWFRVIDRSVQLMEEAYISDQFPMYKKTYDIQSGKYLVNDSYNSIDFLLTTLHLAEVGMENEKSIAWLYREFEERDGIYALYDEMGNPLSQMESTASYALVARLAKVTDEADLYELAMEKMLSLQVVDTESEIYGAFGDPLTLGVYSFDNLQALLSF